MVNKKFAPYLSQILDDENKKQLFFKLLKHVAKHLTNVENATKGLKIEFNESKDQIIKRVNDLNNSLDHLVIRAY